MELLTLYKLEKKQIGIQFTEEMVVEFLEDCVAAHSQLAASKGIQLNMQCDDSILWFFDPDMVAIALNNIIGNCLRYTSTEVQVTASVNDGLLCISIDDNGPGYPQSMLQEIGQFENQINFNTGSTGLGLYFAACIAQRHQRKDRQGHIRLKNHDTSSGGSFQIYLP
jgi:signal transduction histidine kinase